MNKLNFSTSSAPYGREVHEQRYEQHLIKIPLVHRNIPEIAKGLIAKQPLTLFSEVRDISRLFFINTISILPERLSPSFMSQS